MARISNGLSAFTPEELGLSSKDLKWYMDKCAGLAVEQHEKGGPVENADILKLLSDAFDSLVMSDANFRKMILTLANIQILQIISTLNNEK